MARAAAPGGRRKYNGRPGGSCDGRKSGAGADGPRSVRAAVAGGSAPAVAAKPPEAAARPFPVTAAPGREVGRDGKMG